MRELPLDRISTKVGGGMIVWDLGSSRAKGGSKNEIPYPSGLGAITGGVISAAYLVFASPALSTGAVPVPILVGLLLTFVSATFLNSMIMSLILMLRFGTTHSLSDYASGALIGSLVTYATVIFFFFSLV